MSMAAMTTIRASVTSISTSEKAVIQEHCAGRMFIVLRATENRVVETIRARSGVAHKLISWRSVFQFFLQVKNSSRKSFRGRGGTFCFFGISEGFGEMAGLLFQASRV